MRGNKTMANTFVDAVTKTVDVNGTSFVYRETGEKNGIPVVLLHHLTAVLDDWDPRTIDGLAQKHRVIAFNNRGVGGSKGTTPDTIDDMATDAVAFIRALGLSKTVREWRGDTHTVLIHADGIEWRGQRYRSLTVVARKITGAPVVWPAVFWPQAAAARRLFKRESGPW